MRPSWIHDEGLPYFSNAVRAEFWGKKIHEEYSPYQHIEVYETEALGRVLRLDKIIQTSEKYGFIYDEAIGVVPALLRPNPTKAFVVGGGDMGTLRALLGLKSITQVTMAEIDEAVIDVSKKFLPTITEKSYEDPRADIYIGDGKAKLEESEGMYDLVIADLTDPIEGSPAEKLFQTEFFRLVKQSLKADGIFSAQSGLLYFQSEEVKTVVKNLREVFEFIQILAVPIPMYGVGPFTFIYASSQPFDVTLDELKQRFAQNVQAPLRYFTPEIIFYSKTLPPFAQEELGLA
jgi:spermidine synthase